MIYSIIDRDKYKEIKEQMSQPLITAEIPYLQ